MTAAENALTLLVDAADALCEVLRAEIRQREAEKIERGLMFNDLAAASDRMREALAAAEEMCRWIRLGDWGKVDSEGVSAKIMAALLGKP